MLVSNIGTRLTGLGELVDYISLSAQFSLILSISKKTRSEIQFGRICNQNLKADEIPLSVLLCLLTILLAFRLKIM